MDFSRLPDNGFLEIFEYLSLEDCIRARRVDKSFRRIAQLMISRTKSLDLTENRFKNLTSNQLAVILDLCSASLERIKFPSHDSSLATRFSKYQCPRLTDIDLGRTQIDYPFFEQLIRNNPNMECLIWRRNIVGFPNIAINRLKKLNLHVYDNVAFQSLIGRCPSLNELDLTMGNINANILDQFFGSIPQVQHVNLHIANNDVIMSNIRFENDLIHFWKLPLISLTIKLSIRFFHFGDDFLYKLAVSFPHLRKLLVGLDRSKSTSAGIAALVALEDLEILELRIFDDAGNHYDHGIRQLANCKKLQKLDICGSKVSGGTLVHLLRSCPQLEHVVIWEITQVANSDEAAVVLETLAGIPQRDITLITYSLDMMVNSIWESKPVKEMIEKLEENAGLKIKLLTM